MTKQLRPKPLIVGLASGLVVAAGLVSLGLWQLDRARFKGALEDAFAERAPTAVDVRSDAALTRFQPLVAEGRYDSDRQILIDNIVERGRNGFYVITPFELDDGSTVLVNRGWVVQDPARRVLPAVDVDESQRRIRGASGTLPVAGIRLGDTATAATVWPHIAAFPTHDDLSALLDTDIRPPLILLDSDQPDGFYREWRPGGMPASRHTGYALQWFALAAAALAMFGYLGYKTARHD